MPGRPISSLSGSATSSVFLIVSLTVTGVAQESSATNGAWQHFLERCGLAHANQERYFDDIASNQATSNGTISATSDGKIRWGSAYGSLYSEGYQVMVVGDRRVELCEVMGILGGTLAHSAAANEAFLTDIAARPGVTASGGAMPEVAMGAGAKSGVEAGTYLYVVDGALPDGILAEVVISPWQVEVYSTHSDAAPQVFGDTVAPAIAFPEVEK